MENYILRKYENTDYEFVKELATLKCAMLNVNIL